LQIPQKPPTANSSKIDSGGTHNWTPKPPSSRQNDKRPSAHSSCTSHPSSKPVGVEEGRIVFVGLALGVPVVGALVIKEGAELATAEGAADGPIVGLVVGHLLQVAFLSSIV